MGSRFIHEPLETRQFLSAAAMSAGADLMLAAEQSAAGAVELAAAANSSVYPPHANVAGQTMAEWAADWWAKVFETPVHTDGQVTHPNLDETGANAAQGDVGGAFFLFGSFAPGEVVRSDVTVPFGKPIFVPVLPMEFSNYDTADPDGNYPAQYTADELRGFAGASAQSVLTGGDLRGSIDGVPIQGLQAHRERAPVTYTLPEQDNLLQFFGLPFSGLVSPASVDGFYFMVKPLAPGEHTLRFGGTIPENPAPLLSNFDIDMTYNITVEAPPAAAAATAAPQAGIFSDRPVDSTVELAALEPASATVL